MGIGDDLMWRAEAYHYSKSINKPVAPFRQGRKQSCNKPVWQHTPWIHPLGVPFETHPINGKRWYYQHRPYTPKTAPFEYTQEEMQWFQENVAHHKPYIVINPDYKTDSMRYPLKCWYGWDELIQKLSNYTLLRCQPPNSQPVDGLHNINTTFRQSMLVIKYSACLITTEGGLHHAAGHQSVPSITIYGSATTPFCTGYETSKEIVRFTDCNPDGFGHYTEHEYCEQCVQAMKHITADEIIVKLEEILCQ
tara:strand:+ start:1238 stop:1987 length:750 start_codon:yes stop_codon:yes gene_type:complete